MSLTVEDTGRVHQLERVECLCAHDDVFHCHRARACRVVVLECECRAWRADTGPGSSRRARASSPQGVNRVLVQSQRMEVKGTGT